MIKYDGDLINITQLLDIKIFPIVNHENIYVTEHDFPTHFSNQLTKKIYDTNK